MAAAAATVHQAHCVGIVRFDSAGRAVLAAHACDVHRVYYFGRCAATAFLRIACVEVPQRLLGNGLATPGARRVVTDEAREVGDVTVFVAVNGECGTAAVAGRGARLPAPRRVRGAAAAARACRRGGDARRHRGGCVGRRRRLSWTSSRRCRRSWTR
jgi:hypothetical protein